MAKRKAQKKSGSSKVKASSKKSNKRSTSKKTASNAKSNKKRVSKKPSVYQTNKRSSTKSDNKNQKEPDFHILSKDHEYDIGKLSFLFGVIIALVTGIFIGVGDFKINVGVGIVYGTIFILGIIVGLFNITIKEVNEFLLASLVFLGAGGLNLYVLSESLPQLGGLINQIYMSLSYFVAPAATVVSIKILYKLAKKR